MPASPTPPSLPMIRALKDITKWGEPGPDHEYLVGCTGCALARIHDGLIKRGLINADLTPAPPTATIKPTTIEAIKRLAKQIKAAKGVIHSVALDIAARQAGYSDFRHALRALVPAGTADAGQRS